MAEKKKGHPTRSDGPSFPVEEVDRLLVPWWLCRFFSTDVERAKVEAPAMSTEEAVATFGQQSIMEQLDSLPREYFEQEFCATFVDESYSYYPYDLILPNTDDKLLLAHEFSDIPFPEGRIVAGFDVGRIRDRSELAVFEDRNGHLLCRLLRSYDQVPFAEQEADLRRFLETVPVARLSIDRRGIGMNLAENLCRDYPQVVGEKLHQRLQGALGHRL